MSPANDLGPPRVAPSNRGEITCATSVSILAPRSWIYTTNTATADDRAALPSGIHIAFLAQYNEGQVIAPTSVPSRADVVALKLLGLRTLNAFFAAGSLRRETSQAASTPTRSSTPSKGHAPRLLKEHHPRGACDVWESIER